MTRLLQICAMTCVLALGCGGNDFPPDSGGAGSGGSGSAGQGGSAGAGGAGGAGGGAFGARCNVDTDCAGMGAVCSDSFDNSGKLCTIHCTMASMCPIGSMGQKCNMKGFCRP